MRGALAATPEQLRAFGAHGAARVARRTTPALEVPKLAALIEGSLRESEATFRCVA